MRLQEEDEFIELAIAGIVRVAEALVAVPADRQRKAMDAVKRSYIQAALQLGYDRAIAEECASVIMVRLGVETQSLARRLQMPRAEAARSREPGEVFSGKA